MEAEAKHQQGEVAVIACQVYGAFELDLERQIAVPEQRQDFLTRLDGAFRPPVLLRLERVHFNGQLRGRHDFRQKQKSPTLDLGAITEIEIFGEWIPGEIAVEPLYDPRGARIRA